jgi:hypothetical protein
VVQFKRPRIRKRRHCFAGGDQPAWINPALIDLPAGKRAIFGRAGPAVSVFFIALFLAVQEVLRDRQ